MSDNVIDYPNERVELIEPAETTTDGPVYLITANGQQGLDTRIIDAREQAPNAFPPRNAATRVVTDTASFLAEIKRRPLLDGRSTVWGSRQYGTVSAIYDELYSNAEEEYTRRNDALVLQFVRDPDWNTLFTAADGEYHGQEEFGDLIEQAGHLIVSHPAAELMEIIDSIRASSKGSFESQIKRATGSQTLTYSEEVNTTAGSVTRPLEVPREVTLSARPFEDYPRVDVTCWLRLRIAQGRLYLGLIPKPYEHLVRDAWTQVTGDLAEQLGVPVYASNLGK
ncbi:MULTISPECIES: DUF2303 family protein [Mycobacteriaceae]|uniref:DUF2303 family protein n=1 Tax=Mycobacteriaceae TaxID=1762 RepID=UPI0009932818|nr:MULTISPECIES: DUF2303 family protein [Mycobacteriaceae]MDO3058502.1 DUF2303 family protein [Mycobacteroides abscessus subsp. abscessus]MDO3277962.1 DUF2303 family protein [Mycobacteroides abscessus subsp. abscessus]